MTVLPLPAPPARRRLMPAPAWTRRWPHAQASTGRRPAAPPHLPGWRGRGLWSSVPLFGAHAALPWIRRGSHVHCLRPPGGGGAHPLKGNYHPNEPESCRRRLEWKGGSAALIRGETETRPRVPGVPFEHQEDPLLSGCLQIAANARRVDDALKPLLRRLAHLPESWFAQGS